MRVALPVVETPSMVIYRFRSIIKQANSELTRRHCAGNRQIRAKAIVENGQGRELYFDGRGYRHMIGRSLGAAIIPGDADAGDPVGQRRRGPDVIEAAPFVGGR